MPTNRDEQAAAAKALEEAINDWNEADRLYFSDPSRTNREAIMAARRNYIAAREKLRRLIAEEN